MVPKNAKPLLLPTILIVAASASPRPQAATITSAPSPTAVTLYEVQPSWFSFDTSDARPIDGTFEFDVSIVGVKTDSAGSETTYSFGEYVSDNDVFTTTVTQSQGQSVTSVVSTPDLIAMSNWTIVESAERMWATYSAYITTNSPGYLAFGEGEYESCTFDSSGGISAASCTAIDFDPFITVSESGTQITTVTGLNTFTTTYGGSKTAITVLSDVAAPSRTDTTSGSAPTDSSNDAGSGFRPWRFESCLSLLIFGGSLQAVV